MQKHTFKNIILIGMPGAGKSTVGVILAKHLGFAFSDTDLLIQTHEGKTLQEILNSCGVEYFLDRERDHILNTSFEHCIIATGGSVIYRTQTMNHLKQNAVTLHLHISYDAMQQRIDNEEIRGIARKPTQTLLDLYHERIPLYEKFADITIDVSHITPKESLNEILKQIEPFTS